MSDRELSLRDRELIRRPINWRKGREQYGPIRLRQVWMKRDTGKLMEITGTNKNNRVDVMFEGDSRGMRCHSLKERDVYRYYILVE